VRRRCRKSAQTVGSWPASHWAKQNVPKPLEEAGRIGWAPFIWSGDGEDDDPFSVRSRGRYHSAKRPSAISACAEAHLTQGRRCFAPLDLTPALATACT
jgi:hypothetical protein